MQPPYNTPTIMLWLPNLFTMVTTAVVVPRGVGKTSPLHRYSVGIFSYSGLSGILDSDGKQNTA